jgi:hypothetical protein
MDSRIEMYRREARECDQRAEEARDVWVKAEWRKAAEEWRKLASAAEKGRYYGW